MPTIRSAHILKAGWMYVTCDNCSSEYSCLVQGRGHASDSFVPASDDDLREAAGYSVRKAMERKAAAIPCPRCGSFNREHVESKQRMLGRIVFWLTFFIIGLGLLVLSAFTRSMVIFFANPVVAFIVARVAANIAIQKSDLNRDLAGNRRVAMEMVSRGIVRLEGPQ